MNLHKTCKPTQTNTKRIKPTHNSYTPMGNQANTQSQKSGSTFVLLWALGRSFRELDLIIQQRKAEQEIDDAVNNAVEDVKDEIKEALE